MGSCVSKTKAARAKQGKVAAPLPVVEKEGGQSALPPVVVVEEEEVKEVVLSETPVPRAPSRSPPEPEPEPVEGRQDHQHPGPGQEAEDETCSASDSASAPKETAKLQKAGGERKEVEKRAADAPEKARTAAREDRERESKKAKGGGAWTAGRARSPSHRRQQQQPHPPAQRREHPAVVSGIGCRSGRFSASAARRAAESAAVRRTHSAREADMALPSKRSLAGAPARRERDPGERSWRRSDSPTGRRAAPASPSSAANIHRAGTTGPMRNKAAAKEHGHGHGTPERGSSRPPRARDGGDEQPGPWAGGGAEVGGEQKRRLAAEEEGALGQNPSVAMECFIFL
ncbi:hypothetical protein BS78_01G165100 [Paspalum vaginatum]|nr:hypothetical protein BS78_01G165100 [Paspalum vaginatum]